MLCDEEVHSERTLALEAPSRDLSMALPSGWQELPVSILALWDRHVPAALKNLVGARPGCGGALSTHHASCAHHGTSPWAFLHSLLVLDTCCCSSEDPTEICCGNSMGN